MTSLFTFVQSNIQLKKEVGNLFIKIKKGEDTENIVRMEYTKEMY